MAAPDKVKVPDCVQDRINKYPNRKWQIIYKEPYGRCIVASENISESDVLFIDEPLITGPKQASQTICLGCYTDLDHLNYYSCSKCGWPMCSSKCERVGYHSLECKIFSKSGYVPTSNDFQNDQKYVYEAILPLRCFLQKYLNPSKWEALISLESHDDLRKGNELWQREEINVVNFLLETLKIEADSALLHTITGILNVNCHEVRSTLPGQDSEYRVRGLYPLCAMMSHECMSNTHHTVCEGNRMMVIASRNIPKGTMVTCSYTHLLSGTTGRRKHLKYSKFFDCFCNRCEDPSENGTYFSSILCQQRSCNGFLMCQNPVIFNNNPNYNCNKCYFVMKAGIVNKLNNDCYKELAEIDEIDPEPLEKIFNHYKRIFHPNHFHLIGIKHSLSQIYGKVPNYMINELTPKILDRKIQCCEDLLNILDILDPGISRLRGMTKYELHAPILLNANAKFQAKKVTRSYFLECLEKSLSLLNGTIYNLQFEPSSSAEGKIHQIAVFSSQELQKWINTVKELPKKNFIPEIKLKKIEITSINKYIPNEDLTLEALLKKVNSW